MIWARYWKDVRGSKQEHYHHFQDGTSEKYIKLHCETWAEEQPGGHNSQYQYGYEIMNPPKDILKEMIEKVNNKISKDKAELSFLKSELKRCKE